MSDPQKVWLRRLTKWAASTASGPTARTSIGTAINTFGLISSCDLACSFQLWNAADRLCHSLRSHASYRTR